MRALFASLVLLSPLVLAPGAQAQPAARAATPAGAGHVGHAGARAATPAGAGHVGHGGARAATPRGAGTAGRGGAGTPGRL